MKFRLILLLLLISSSLAFWLDEPVDLEEVKGVVTTQFLENAKAQSYAGRALYTWPNEATNEEFNSVCKHAWQLVDKLGKLFDDDKCKDSYRSKSNRGAGRTKDDKAVTSADIITQIKRVAEVKGKDATPNDRMVCITTFGDIAQALVDSYVKEYIKKEKINDCIKESQPIIIAYLASLGKKPDLIKDVVLKFYENRSADKMTKGNKKKQRDNPKNEKDNPTPLRSGVYDTGAKADEIIKQKGGTSFIKSIGWPKQKIEELRLKKSAITNEVWAGHITGSGPEVLFLWDLVCENDFPPIWIDYNNCKKKGKGKNPLDETCEELNTVQRKARTAIVLGFLLGAGFHSAFESHLVVNQYTGFNYWPSYKDDKDKNDTADTEYMNDATKTMTDILKKHTVEPKGKRRRRRRKNLK